MLLFSIFLSFYSISAMSFFSKSALILSSLRLFLTGISGSGDLETRGSSFPFLGNSGYFFSMIGEGAFAYLTSSSTSIT